MLIVNNLLDKTQLQTNPLFFIRRNWEFVTIKKSEDRSPKSEVVICASRVIRLSFGLRPSFSCHSLRGHSVVIDCFNN